MNSSKTSYSLMFCGNGKGDLLPPYVVFKSVHLYHEWTRNGPKGAMYNRTKSGWFDEAAFEDWFFQMMLPKLRKQKGKKVMIGDNLSSHLSERVIKACSENNISFICLLPNATHLLQPLDIAFFSSLKRVWRDLLRSWRLTPRGRKMGTLPKEDFSLLLNKLFCEITKNSSTNLQSGFRKCGLVPYNPDEVFKMLPSENILSPSKAMDESVLNLLQELRGEDEDEPARKTKRTRLDVQPGKSVTVPDEAAEERESESEADDTVFADSDEEEESDEQQSIDSADSDLSDSADDSEIDAETIPFNNVVEQKNTQCKLGP